jgi:hypothetical protein
MPVMWQRLAFLIQPTKPGDVSLGGEENPDAEVVELQTQTALVFIVTSSLVLLFLFFFNSVWSAWLLVFLFCLGAVQVHTQLIPMNFAGSPDRRRTAVTSFETCHHLIYLQGMEFVASSLIVRCA